jgi:protein TonB
MLDYVNSINQKRGVSRLTIVSLAASCFLHFCGIMTLYLFPQLLAGGYLHQFRGFRWGATGTAITDEDMEKWRMVAFLEPPDRMNMPSPETLRKILSRGEKEEGAGSPPVEVRFGPPEALISDKPPLPQIPPKIEEPEVVIPADRRPGDGETKSDTGISGESPTTEPADPGTGRDIIAAKPDAAPAAESAVNTAPAKIPDTIPPPAPPPAAKPDVSEPVASNETGRNSGVEFLDAEGFPMGEYSEVIKMLVSSKWLIPSYLKDIVGRTAVVFYIDRNGNVNGLRVDASSGNKPLDTAALGAVLNAGPFPPLPKGFPKERVGVRIFLNRVP